jgi:hypothetical protein
VDGWKLPVRSSLTEIRTVETSKVLQIKLGSGNDIGTVIVPGRSTVHPRDGLDVAETRVISHQGTLEGMLIGPGRMLLLYLPATVSQNFGRLSAARGTATLGPRSSSAPPPAATAISANDVFSPPTGVQAPATTPIRTPEPRTRAAIWPIPTISAARPPPRRSWPASPDWSCRSPHT